MFMEIHEIYQNVHKDTDFGTDCQIISFHVSFLIQCLGKFGQIILAGKSGICLFHGFYESFLGLVVGKSLFHRGEIVDLPRCEYS